MRPLGVRRCLWIILCLTLVSVFSRGISAQDTGVSGFNLQFYQPALDRYGYLGVNSPRLQGAGEFHLKMSQNVALRHIFDVGVDDQVVAIVERIVTANFLGSIGVNDLFTLGADLPIHLYFRGANFDSLESFNATALGDMRLLMKFRLLDERVPGWRPGLALLVTNSLPTGNESNFLGTSAMVPGAEILIGKEFPLIELLVNLGARFPRQKNVLGLDRNDEVTYGIAGKMPFGFLDPLLSILGEIRGHFDPTELRIVEAPVEFTVGLRKEFARGIIIDAGGGGAWNNAIGNPRIRGIVSVSYSAPFERSRRLEPVTKPPPARPAEPAASQGASEADLIEAQPPIPELSLTEEIVPPPLLPVELSQRIQTTVYFPAGSAEPNPESLRWVSEVATLLKAYPDAQRISIEGHTDNLGPPPDIFPLSVLRATTVKELLVREGIAPERIVVQGYGADRPAQSNETPAGPMLNRRVEIRALPQPPTLAVVEASPTPVEPSGTPPPTPAPLAPGPQAPEPPEFESLAPEPPSPTEPIRPVGPGQEGLPTQPQEPAVGTTPPPLPVGLRQRIHTTVYFPAGGAELNPESLRWVSEVVILLKLYPEVQRIAVEGHTDSLGTPSEKFRISVLRATTVQELLVREGIAPERIVVQGYGADQPAQSNDTPEGRVLNRRVEIRVF